MNFVIINVIYGNNSNFSYLSLASNKNIYELFEAVCEILKKINTTQEVFETQEKMTESLINYKRSENTTIVYKYSNKKSDEKLDLATKKWR